MWLSRAELDRLEECCGALDDDAFDQLVRVVERILDRRARQIRAQTRKQLQKERQSS